MSATESPPVRVALIFDDGPLPEPAQRLLAILDREGVRVTFGAVGRNVAEHPAIARAVVAAGHEIANHSYAHQHPKDLNDAALAREITEAQEIITATTQVAPRWYWPPFLERDERMTAITARAGLAVYEPPHLIISEDYRTDVPAAEIHRKATTGVVDRSVILFHEWRNETLDELPGIIADLRRQGAVFLTFSELAATTPARPND